MTEPARTPEEEKLEHNLQAAVTISISVLDGFVRKYAPQLKEKDLANLKIAVRILERYAPQNWVEDHHYLKDGGQPPWEKHKIQTWERRPIVEVIDTTLIEPARKNGSSRSRRDDRALSERVHVPPPRAGRRQPRPSKEDPPPPRPRRVARVKKHVAR